MAEKAKKNVRTRSASVAGDTEESSSQLNLRKSRAKTKNCEMIDHSDDSLDENNGPFMVEDDIIKTARWAYSTILSNVPQTSDNIKIESRKEVRRAAMILYEKALQLAGVILEVRKQDSDLKKQISEACLSQIPVLTYANAAGRLAASKDANGSRVLGRVANPFLM